MSRFVRASKYRHAFGTPNKKEQCFDNLKVSKNAWDTNLVKANGEFVSVNLEAGGGGAFAVLTHDNTGKLSEGLPVFNGHSGAVLDTDFHPFNDYIIASASEDTKVMLWKIPQGGLTESINTPLLSLNNHCRKVGHVLFNPVAENVLASASADYTVKIWDIGTGAEKQTLTGHQEVIQSLTWNWEGNLLATTCKDKKIRIFDVRSDTVVQEIAGHAGIKGSRVAWMGDLNKIVTTGFSKTSDRQIFVWDSHNLSEPLKQENVDTASGMLMPFYDEGTCMLYVAGKGDGNIRYYEWVDDEKGLYYLSEYKSADPQRGISFLPKRNCNIADCEIARAYKVHVSMVEPISFKVPRKSDAFQADLFPDCIGATATMTSAEFWANKKKTMGPKMISLQDVPMRSSVVKEFVTTAEKVEKVEIRGPQNEKEFQDAYHSLRKENEDLKNQLSTRDIRITQLEAQLAACMKK